MAVKITAEELEQFANTHLARDLLPELLRRLIRATSPEVTGVYFPSGESTFRPGVDGIVQAAPMPPYIPAGLSLWEVGTNDQAAQKIRSDFDKRSGPSDHDDYAGQVRAEIVYVAVSLRRVNATKAGSIAQLESSLRDRGVWRDVKILDADSLEDWLDSQPSVRSWLALKMYKASADMRDVEGTLASFLNSASPVIPVDLLLANRDAAAEKVRKAALSAELTRVKADSPREAVSFVAAALLGMNEGDPMRGALLAKTVVIADPSSKSQLLVKGLKLVVVTVNAANDVAQELSNYGHAVITCYGTSHAKSGNSQLIALPRASRQSFVDILVANDMDEARAKKLAAACHSSVSIFRRQNDGAHSEQPVWASRTTLKNLSGIILAGAYAHDNVHDQDILKELAGASDYQNVDDAILDVLRIDDAPVLREGSVTALSAPADIWQLSIEHRAIGKIELNRFSDAAVRVLSELDPALDMPLDQRAYANIYGKSRAWSQSLRSGLSEILRLIAINEDNLNYITDFSAQNFVNDVLRKIPGLADDYKMLASLDPLLPALAEAAPDPFLSALEGLLATDPSLLLPIFEGGDDAMFGHVYYLGMLRALEVLAWDPERLSRVALLLARLAAIDPGGRLSNRPIESLVQIFLPWSLHTNAASAIRHRVLDRVCKMVPDVAWALISKLLPGEEDISFGTSEPEWRDFGASERAVTTYGSIRRDHEFIIDMASQEAGIDPSKWVAVIEAATKSMPPQASSKYINLVESRREAFFEAGTGHALWRGLRSLVDKHRSYADAEWAMPSEALDPIDRVADLFAPSDPLVLHQALFEQHMPERQRPDETFDSLQERVLAERDAAIRDVVALGVEELIDFATRVQFPQTMLPSIMRVCNADQWRQIALTSLDRSSAVAWLGACVLANSVSSLGTLWGLEILQFAKEGGASAAQVASLVVPWGDTRELLDLVNELPEDVQAEYWCHRDVYVRTPDDDLVRDFVCELMRHGRSVSLIEFVGGRRSKFETALLLDLLAGALESIATKPGNAGLLSSYWLREVFNELRDREDADRNRLLQLEYSWLPALHSHGATQELALHQYMAESPAFFVEVLSDLYRSEAKIGVDESEDAQHAKGAGELELARAKASSAYKLLDSWRVLPWKNSDGELDAEAILNWVGAVLDAAQEVRRGKVAASEIGKLLAYAPEDRDDGIWPCRQVRLVIEKLENEEMESGIVLELFNKRGAHWRPSDGSGSPERELAAASEEAAKQLASMWPRTARLLRANAKQWIRHAEWHDQRAAEDRISL
ncbi:hypothetical protein [Xanthomonas bonasiae]|uniref:hypothetical protein n=1 Tax=Xanthomonas bonasiae TaxID=2810351 RepID=UPI00177F21E3|nr:hypothetical protein [Xanthomonas surreyensis]MBD7923847.1 hypothetical protein [Xanthomonas surreyensis]